MKFYENLTNTTSSTASSVQIPDRERVKGQRRSVPTVAKFSDDRLNI